ncbi:MAG: hypothetical protein C0408_05155 [Odoribacter sp.]|nr:hypothetical protein [Odoribacter sp.]
MKKNYFVLLLFVFQIFLSGCATNKFLVKDPSFTEPILIAVLPFSNETTDLAACELERLFFFLGMEEKGYKVLDMTTTDSLLQKAGITDGGQLNSISSKELKNLLKVEGLLYGTLVEAQYSTLAVVSKKRVTVRIDLIKDDKSVWKDQETVKVTSLGKIFTPLAGLASQVTDKAFAKAFAKYHGHPIEDLLEQTAYKLQNKMPGKRVEVSGW